MVITLAGNNRYQVNRRLSELVDIFVKQNGPMSLEQIDGEDVDSQVIIGAVQGGSLLSTAKQIVVRDLSLSKQAQTDIEQIISSVDETTNLILVEPNIDRRSAYFKVLKSKTEFEDYNELSLPDLSKWLVGEAKKQGAKLNPLDANYLVDRVGTNQAMLANELDKLITADSEISRSKIDELVPKTPQSRIFELLDAAFNGRKGRALELYGEQRAQKVEPPAILAMIAWQLELLVFARLGRDSLPNQVAKDAGVSPFPVQKAQGLLAKITDKKLKEMIDEAYKIDVLSKSKPIDLDEALKTYIMTL